MIQKNRGHICCAPTPPKYAMIGLSMSGPRSVLLELNRHASCNAIGGAGRWGMGMYYLLESCGPYTTNPYPIKHMQSQISFTLKA